MIGSHGCIINAKCQSQSFKTIQFVCVGVEVDHSYFDINFVVLCVVVGEVDPHYQISSLVSLLDWKGQ